ncbi:MAG: hypothetical protein ABW321_07595, partial [Polyangiales bacterium]
QPGPAHSPSPLMAAGAASHGGQAPAAPRSVPPLTGVPAGASVARAGGPATSPGVAAPRGVAAATVAARGGGPASAAVAVPITSAAPSSAEPAARSLTLAAAPTPPPAADFSAHGNNVELWSRIVGQVRSAQPALGAVLDHGMPLEVSASTLKLGFPEGSFFGRQAQSTSAREGILKAAELVLGARPNLLIGAPGNAKISTLAEIEENGRQKHKAARREAALTHPRVLDAMEIFEESEASVDVQVDLE